MPMYPDTMEVKQPITKGMVVQNWPIFYSTAKKMMSDIITMKMRRILYCLQRYVIAPLRIRVEISII